MIYSGRETDFHFLNLSLDQRHLIYEASVALAAAAAATSARANNS